MTHKAQLREWRDDVPRSFSYTPRVAPARPRSSSFLHVIVALALGR